jgi:hypothetical protein
MAEGLVQLIARGIGDERNLRPFAELRQSTAKIPLNRCGVLSESRTRGKDENEK